RRGLLFGLFDLLEDVALDVRLLRLVELVVLVAFDVGLVVLLVHVAFDVRLLVELAILFHWISFQIFSSAVRALRPPDGDLASNLPRPSFRNSIRHTMLRK